MVAIPAVIAFNYFSRKLRVLLGGADQAAHAVLSLVHGADAEKLNPMPESTSKADA
jgi:biopolymer transport protein ExbB/TolQ